MKVYVNRSSNGFNDGNVREYDSLENCVETLLETEDFHGWSHELIIAKPDDITPDIGKDCKYTVEIYDSWRE